MKHKDVFLALLSLLLLERANATMDDASTPDLPNFVLVLTDDMGMGDVGFNKEHHPGAGGDEWLPNPPRTPELDLMASSEHSILFHRFYAGSPVCSPTRASCLTGRTPDRDCITYAEGCGQAPAWSCGDDLPLSPRTFTIAEAAKSAGYSTAHIGKWHLGNFFPKPGVTKDDYANNKWPVSSPRVHGFDEWYATEASASSSLCNCNCNAAWPYAPAGDPLPAPQGIGCIVGGGNFTSDEDSLYECTNYWGPSDLDPDTHLPTDPDCAEATPLISDNTKCVMNTTEKILGDDTMHIMDVFENFLDRKVPGGTEYRGMPFLAVLWLHTVHVPHPAMPEWYHAYTDAYGEPAGDYLGTISQMDAQIGRLRGMLEAKGVKNNTALWFASDNGPHTSDGGGCDGANPRTSLQATNGLRQCKESVFEGGIRVPGILEWPARIPSHRETFFPAVTHDYLPTFLEATGVAHAHPDWETDGVSLVPIIDRAAALPKDQVLFHARRHKALGFQLSDQQAWIDDSLVMGRTLKLVRNPGKGQCSDWLEPWNKTNTANTSLYPLLFDLDSDPTESIDLSTKVEPGILASMVGALDQWAASILVSQTDEAECAESS